MFSYSNSKYGFGKVHFKKLASNLFYTNVKKESRIFLHVVNEKETICIGRKFKVHQLVEPKYVAAAIQDAFNTQ